MSTFVLDGATLAPDTDTGAVYHLPTPTTVSEASKPAATRALLVQMARAKRGPAALQEAGRALDAHGDEALSVTCPADKRVRRYLLDAGCALPEPPVKWLGGKRKLADRILGELGTGDTWCEPFVGGGGVFLRALALGVAHRYVVGDADADVVLMWTAIRDECEAIVANLQRWCARWVVGTGADPLHHVPESHFYDVRDLDPRDLSTLDRVARFVILNRACFNGLVRRNARGYDNAPWGGADRTWCIGVENLRRISRMIQRVEIIHGDFAATVEAARRPFVVVTGASLSAFPSGAGGMVEIKPGVDVKVLPPGHTLLYLDSPYWPDRPGGFVGYRAGGFGPDEHKRLASLAWDAAQVGRVVASNNDVPDVRALYNGFGVVELTVGRPVARSAEGRKGVGELLLCAGVRHA